VGSFERQWLAAPEAIDDVDALAPVVVNVVALNGGVVASEGADGLSPALGRVAVLVGEVGAPDLVALNQGVVRGLAVVGRGLVESAWIEIPAIGGMEFEDVLEYLETDSGRENAERRRRLNENLTRALLLVGDKELADRTAVLTQRVRDWPEKAVGPVTDKKVRGQRKTDAVA
jgi:hypothetical protein